MAEIKKHTHNGHRQRMKKKAREGGIEHWPYHEILELWLMYAIPRKDVNPLAHKLIDHFGSFGAVFDAGFEQLKNFDGLGEESALFLSLLPDMFAKYNASKNTDAVILDTPLRCANYFKSNYRFKPIEEFYIFCLDAKKRIIAITSLTSGLSLAVDVGVGGLAKTISRSGANSFVVMHNHPNGKAEPSQADILSTKRFIDLSIAIGVALDDHVIVTENGYFSFRNSHLYEQLYKVANSNFQQGRTEATIIAQQLREFIKQD